MGNLCGASKDDTFVGGNNLKVKATLQDAQESVNLEVVVCPEAKFYDDDLTDLKG